MDNNRALSQRTLASVVPLHGGETALSTEVRNPATAHDDDVVDPLFFWWLLKQYKAIFIGFTLSAAALALLVSFILRPVFTGEAIVRVNQNTSIYQGGVDVTGLVGRSDWKAGATAIKLMDDREVALRVVERLNLVEMPEFNGKLRQRSMVPNFSAIKDFFTSSKSTTEMNGREVKSELRQRSMIPDFSVIKGFFTLDKPTTGMNESESKKNAVSYLLGRLSIKEVKKTNIIKVRYQSFIPETSALVANEIADAFNELDAERRQVMSDSVQLVLEGELQKTQEKLQVSEKKLTQFARKTGIVDLDDRNNIVSARAASLSSAFIVAQNELMELEIQIQGAKQSDNLMLVPFVNESGAIIAMRADLTRLETEYSELAGVFKPEYPPLLALKTRIALTREQMNSEARRIFDELVSRYKNAAEAERILSSEIEKNNIDLLDLKDRSITFNILKREWESNKHLYDGLLQKVKSSALAANLEMDRLSLVGVAIIPDEKSSPNIIKNVVVAVLIGFFLAMGLAFLLSLLDRRFRSIQELEDVTKMPVLAVVPFIENVDELKQNHVALLPSEKPGGVVGETFRSLRTSLNYAMPGEDIDSLMVTSPSPSEGKSTTIVNLGITLAKGGMKTLIIDFDLRKPSLHKVVEKPRSPGLTDALVNGSIQVSDTAIDNLQVLTAGTKTPSPTEILDSDSCRNLVRHLRKEFDILLFDAPPVMGLADALVASQYLKNILMVVDMSISNKDAIQAALQRLQRVNAPVIGMVVTKHDPSAHGAGYQGAYYYYED